MLHAGYVCCHIYLTVVKWTYTQYNNFVYFNSYLYTVLFIEFLGKIPSCVIQQVCSSIAGFRDIEEEQRLRDRPFNLKGGYGFLFPSEFFFRTTQSQNIYVFPEFNICMTITLNQIIYFFLQQNQNIFFSNIGNQNIVGSIFEPIRFLLPVFRFC